MQLCRCKAPRNIAVATADSHYQHLLIFFLKFVHRYNALSPLLHSQFYLPVMSIFFPFFYIRVYFSSFVVIIVVTGYSLLYSVSVLRYFAACKNYLIFFSLFLLQLHHHLLLLQWLHLRGCWVWSRSNWF